MVPILVLALASPAPARAQGGSEGAAAPTERLEQLEKEVEALKAEVARLAAAGQTGGQAADAARLAEVERRLEVLATEIERLKIGEADAAADTSEHGLGPAASKVYRTERGVSIGGYGEALYQGFDSRRDDGSPAGESDTIDLLRAVVYVGYKFDDRWVLNSELEWEHANTDKGGEAAVEFAYLDFLWKPQLSLRGGLLLMPVGFLNELHEPTVFLGARRPDVEDVIIPTTWRENGFGLFGESGPLRYRAYLVSGFDATGFSAEEGLSEGRSEGAEAKAEDFALVGRLDYTPIPGLLLGGSAYAGDSGQDLRTPEGRRIGVATRLAEGHFEWRRRGLELRALGVQADLDDVAALDRALGLAGEESVGEKLRGFYLQAGYDLFARWPHGEQSLIPFARYESFDTQARVPAGFRRDPANDRTSLTLGLNYRPIAQIVLKADYQNYDDAAGTALDQVNVALGYIF